MMREKAVPMPTEEDFLRAQLEGSRAARQQAEDGLRDARAKVAKLAAALRTISALPMPEQDNPISASMRKIANDALNGLWA